MAKGRRSRWTRDAKLKRLAQVPLFSALNKGDLVRIASLADEVEVPAGRVLMRQGELGREAFVILKGKAKVSVRGGRNVTLGAGACLGEMALLEPRGERSATVTAETDMELLVLGSRQFSALIDEMPSVARRILAGVAERLRASERPQAHH